VLDLSEAKSIQRYDNVKKVGTGQYGDVYVGVHKLKRHRVAVKRLKSGSGMKNEILDMLAVREIKILKGLDHENVIGLIEVATDDADKNGRKPVFVIMPCMSHDLRGLLTSEHSKWWPQNMLKGLCWQILCGIQYCHSRGVLHRDLKPENILMDNAGVLKIADFGLAKVHTGEYHKHTNSVVTRWYRAPELLLGTRAYGKGIDIWALGCIFGELLMNAVLLPGVDDQNQLDLIWDLCGTPNTSGWRAGTTLPHYRKMGPQTEQTRDMHAKLRLHKRNTRRAYFTEPAVNMLGRMMLLDHRRRSSADTLKKDPYFLIEKPKAMRPDIMPKYSRSYFSTSSSSSSSSSKGARDKTSGK